MINVAHLVQLKAFARQDALLLALLWAASFACIMMLNAGLIGNILALATPFLVGKPSCCIPHASSLRRDIVPPRLRLLALCVHLRFISVRTRAVRLLPVLGQWCICRAHHYNDEASSTRLRTERRIERRDQEQHGPHNDDHTRTMGVHVYDAKPRHRCDY